MSFINGTKYNNENCRQTRSNKLDKYIKDNQGGIITLPERQFNCPPCIQSKKSSCSIPSSVKPPCDGMKCFNCPPKYLCFDVNMCHFANDDDKVILKQESK
ncbi:unnamed protein product [Adineta steineri]|uniref:Uncharacterized protein n=1 Tax=Adineta steineri TaxID=433720 RepID=A0A819FTD6_9BILA|nr:unnamed protein product [Adineta steineri]